MHFSVLLITWVFRRLIDAPFGIWWELREVATLLLFSPVKLKVGFRNFNLSSKIFNFKDFSFQPQLNFSSSRKIACLLPPNLHLSIFWWTFSLIVAFISQSLHNSQVDFSLDRIFNRFIFPHYVFSHSLYDRFTHHKLGHFAVVALTSF